MFPSPWLPPKFTPELKYYFGARKWNNGTDFLCIHFCFSFCGLLIAMLMSYILHNLREWRQTWLTHQPEKITVKTLELNRCLYQPHLALPFQTHSLRSAQTWFHTRSGGQTGTRLIYTTFSLPFWRGKIPITHHIQWLTALLNDSHFTLEALFSTVLLEAETGTGKSLLSLKATENRSLWASRSFSLQLHNYRYSGLSSSSRAWRGSLSPLHPSVNGALKAIWLFVAPGISPQVESRVSDEDSIGEENKWHMTGGGGQRLLFGNYLLSQSRGRKRHLEVSCSLQMHEEYFACACHSILSSYMRNWSDIFSVGKRVETGCFPTDYVSFR